MTLPISDVSARTRLRPAAALLALALPWADAIAQGPAQPRPAAAVSAAPAVALQPVSAPAGDLRSFGQQWLAQRLPRDAVPAGAPGLRVEVQVGELDPRLQLAPCARIEPWLPPGTRLWGRSRVGLRCVDGAQWNVFLPVTVQAFGPAWLPTRPIPAGTALTLADFTNGEADWAAQPSPVAQAPEQWVGQLAAQALTPGQPLRLSMLRPPQAFAAGSTVRLLVQGAGFSVSGEGQAISAGHVGQPVRVRTDSGRTVSGIVLDNRTVQINL